MGLIIFRAIFLAFPILVFSTSTRAGDDSASAATTGGRLDFSPAAISVSEAIGNVSLSVSRTGGSDGFIFLSWDARDGTAESPDDYTAVSGSLTWNDGDNSNRLIFVPIANDDDPEPTEWFVVKLTGIESVVPVQLGASTATVSILKSDFKEITLDMTAEVATYSEVGDTVNYTYRVTSTGDIPVAGPIIVLDNMLVVSCPPVSATGNGDDYLDTEESLVCTGSHSVNHDDIVATFITNKALAEGDGGTTISEPVMVTINYAPELMFCDGFETGDSCP